jgi:ribosomal protein S12 methylthiotransferase accessory factor
MVLDFPRWSEAFHVQVVDDDNVVLIDEYEYYVLTGRPFARLAADLTGENGVADLIVRHSAHLSAPEILYTLVHLEKQGFVREAEPSARQDSRAFWQGLGVTSRDAAARLSVSAVRLEAVGPVDLAPIETALKEAGVAVDAAAALAVVVTDDYLRPELGAFNARQVADGAPWLLAKPMGSTIWLGPLFRPGETGCWDCLANRLRSNRQVERFLETLGGEPPRLSRSAYPPHLAIAANLMAAEVAKACVGSKSALDGTVLSLDTRTWQSERHTLVRRPQCPTCGDADYGARAPQPIRPASAPIRFRADGGHRIVPPDVTYRRLQHHVSAITGVVTNLSNMHEDDESGLSFSYSAGHNFAMMDNTLNWLLQNMRGRSGGKGATDIQAKVSAICEAIERYSGLYDGSAIETRASYRDLGARALHPNALMTFSQAQLGDQKGWNARQRSAYHKAPVPFDETREIGWTPAWSFERQDFVYVPSAYCYYGHPDLKAQYFCTCDANGNAAGNSIEEAIVQGFLELVERDCVALWWYNRLSCPGVDIAAFKDLYFDRLVDYYRRDGRETWALDITSDLGVPCFAAISRRIDRKTEDIVIGFGAHFDARLALMRALTEVNQFMPAVSKTDAAGETIYWFHDPDAVDWWRTATLVGEPYLAPAADRPLRTPADFAAPEAANIRGDVERCAAIARQAGSELLVLDQTQPDIGLPVVKVMVPGLRHFWKRFGPGRLYDVPVAMGWLKTPTAETNLNPTGIFF